jgi:hypothetical protein
MRFFLGTHEVCWLERVPASLFISRRRLAPRKRLPRALRAWALDSGGFSELSGHGAWTLDARQYAGEVRRFSQQIGRLEWAAVQDWMCEPAILRRTGLSIAEHQARTITSFEDLCSLAPELPWVPVLQGWRMADYLRHLEMYERRGHSLNRWPLVGIGTMCRRQSTEEATQILSRLAACGLRLHGFGVRIGALRRGAAEHLISADSLAWSLRARFTEPLPGCTHRNCANCERFALNWLRRVQREIHRSATEVGMRRACALGVRLGRPPGALPNLSKVLKLLQRGSSVRQVAALLDCSEWVARRALAACVKKGR